MIFPLIKHRLFVDIEEGTGLITKEVYQNDLDYCLLNDYMAYLRTADQKRAKEEEQTGLFGGMSSYLTNEEIHRLLKSIYSIQRAPFASQQYKQMVSELMPFEFEYKRDTDSRDFLKELWFTGECCERLLKSGVQRFNADKAFRIKCE